MQQAFDTQKFSGRGLGYQYAQELWRMFQRYNLFVSLDGRFFDKETKMQLHANHVKCLLRNDYLKQEDPELRGAQLSDILDRFLDGVRRAVRVYGEFNPDEIQLVDTDENFIS